MLPKVAISTLVFTAAVLGCRIQTDSDRVHVSLIGTAMTQSDIKPATLPYTKGALLLEGTEIPVDLRSVSKADKFTIELVAHGEVIELERYADGGASFGLVEIGGQVFAPELPLLRYPFNPGNSWDWKGKLGMANWATNCSGKVSTSSERLNLPGGPYDTVKVSVKLAIDNGPGRPAERTLEFWFKPAGGIIKRQIHMSSTREPLAE